jgi:protein-disulfide isomerase-like protein with CxxC motif
MIEIEAIMTSMTEGMDMIETRIVKGIVIEIGIEIEDEIENEIETETEVTEMIIQALAKIIVLLIHSLPDLRLLFLLHQLSVIKTGVSLPFLNNQMVSM